MKLLAPNGLVFELPESVATGLLASTGSGFREVPEPAPAAVEPPSEPDTKPKPRRTRKPKTEAPA